MAEMKFVRAVGGFRPDDMIRNDEISAQLKFEKLNSAAEEQRQSAYKGGQRTSELLNH
jgi:hypothetical protein